MLWTPFPVWEAWVGLDREDLPAVQKQPLLLVRRACKVTAHLPLSPGGPDIHTETMGTLGGHLVAGIFFFFSLYYSVLVSLALLRGQRFLKPPLPPREKRGHRWWQLVPVEGVGKVDSP